MIGELLPEVIVCRGLCWMLTMMRFGYVFVMLVLLGWAGSHLLESAPGLYEDSPSIGSMLMGIVILTVSIMGAWNALSAAISLLLAVLLVSFLDRWTYLLVVMTLANWLAMHLLNYVSRLAVWPLSLFSVCWLALLLLALEAPFRRRWRDLAIACLVLFHTYNAFARTYLVPDPVVLPNRWLQEVGFRIYASHLIRSTPSDELLSKCNLVKYTEEDGAAHEVGECDKGLRSTMLFRLHVIYDPSGQSAWPAIQRTSAWRLAVLHLPKGDSLVHDDVMPLVGNFYWLLDSSHDRGDDGKVRSD